MKLINETQQFQTEELKAFLKRIAKGVNTHNILVVVKKPRMWDAENRRSYFGRLRMSKRSYRRRYRYTKNGHDIYCAGIIRMGVENRLEYPYKYRFKRYGKPDLYVEVDNPLNILGLIFLHELYGVRLARNGKNHYQHQCDAWAYKKGKSLGLFEED